MENACFLPLGCRVKVHRLRGRNVKEMWLWLDEEPSFCLLGVEEVNLILHGIQSTPVHSIYSFVYEKAQGVVCHFSFA